MAIISSYVRMCDNWSILNLCFRWQYFTRYMNAIWDLPHLIVNSIIAYFLYFLAFLQANCTSEIIQHEDQFPKIYSTTIDKLCSSWKRCQRVLRSFSASKNDLDYCWEAFQLLKMLSTTVEKLCCSCKVLSTNIEKLFCSWKCTWWVLIIIWAT